MNTISRILGPSITLLCPLVGSSLTSDWVRFLKLNFNLLLDSSTKFFNNQSLVEYIVRILLNTYHNVLSLCYSGLGVLLLIL